MRGAGEFEMDEYVDSPSSLCHVWSDPNSAEEGGKVKIFSTLVLLGILIEVIEHIYFRERINWGRRLVSRISALILVAILTAIIWWK